MLSKGLILIFICVHFVKSEVAKHDSTSSELVRVNKCCEINKIYIGKSCSIVNSSEQWRPLFTSYSGEANLQINHKLVTGSPDCGHLQQWSVYQYQDSTDRLWLLPNGVLRHYYDHRMPTTEEDFETGVLNGKSVLYHDYPPGKYCLDRKSEDRKDSEFAFICVPDHYKEWITTTEFLMRNIINPVTHLIAIGCFLSTAVVYFVMQNLRDLTGNIITTICMCLIVSQSADLVRLLTVFKSHVSLIITESICYIFMLAAFFWLNSLGYYIWKTFKSRNVFLRITDGKKYCYYCSYAWSSTIVLGALALFAHFTMDYSTLSDNKDEQEQIGSLGMIIFFVPVAFTVLMNVFFFATTMKTINKMHTYGRIHHKLRHSFRMFLLLLLVMTITWLFFLSSFSKYDGLINSYIIVNGFQGPLVLYICVFNQKHVLYLIKKTCCYTNCVCSCCRPEPEVEWGDEMTAMNTGL